MDNSIRNQMSSAKDRLKLLVAAIPKDRPIAYIDPPIHLNVGDLLINIGLEKLLEDNGLPVDIRLSVNDYKKFGHKISGDHVVLLHGGGNMGDIWPGHEDIRQWAVTEFKKNKIILFPQTIHFTNPDNAKKAARAYLEHPDFKMFVRDHQSKAYAEEYMGLEASLCPDTAHQLWRTPEFTSKTEGSGALHFLRRDREAVADSSTNGVDWDDLKRLSDRLGMYGVREAMRRNRSRTMQSFLLSSWYNRRDSIVSRSVKYFDGFQSVRTSRLHGAILGALLEKDVYVQDNFYGKVSRYVDCWLSDVVTVESRSSAS